MALNLNIPKLEDKPNIIAETNPQKIMLNFTRLRSLHSLETASYLHAELELLNRQKVTPGKRIKALDCYRPVLMSTIAALSEDYSDAPLPLQNKAKLSATASELLWLELGYGYKLALIDLQNQLIKIGNSSTYSIQRAMHAIAEQAMVYYQTYELPPSHIWSDLHQLYFCAVQLNVQHMEIKSPTFSKENKSYSVITSHDGTIENTYKHALLISLADPQHLSQKDIRLASEYLTYHVTESQITAVTPLDSSSGAFIITLNSNAPPVPYIKQKNVPDPDSDILLHTLDLVRSVHQLLSNLQNNQLVDIKRDNYIDLLSHLIKHWGVTPKRKFSRVSKDGELELITGISAIHDFSNQNNVSTRVNNESKSSWLHSDSDKKIKPSEWQVLNISPTGMSIRRHPSEDRNIRIGTLLGIKAKNEKLWTLAIVRWAKSDGQERLDIGVQLISPQATSALTHHDSRKFDEKVLLLPEIVAVKQSATIIARRGTFETARKVTLKYNNQSIILLLTKLTERSRFFERMQYSIIS